MKIGDLEYKHYHHGILKRFYGSTIDEVKFNTRTYLENHGEVFTPEIEDYIEKSARPIRQVSARLPEKKNKPITTKNAITAVSALIKNQLGDAVDEKEFIRRSLICKSCPMSSQTSDCVGCGGLNRFNNYFDQLRAKIGAGYRLPSYVKGRFCGFCDCSIPVLAMTKTENIKPKTIDERRPAWCWLNPKSENFKP